MDWKKSPVVALVAGGIGLASIILVISHLARKPSYPTTLICESTGDLFEKKIPLDVKFPLQCPTTGKDEAYLAAKITCKKDGYVFYKPAKEIKMPGSQYPMPPEEAVRFLGIKCPKCGSDDLKFDFPRKIEGSE